jgi:hypothetical protein
MAYRLKFASKNSHQYAALDWLLLLNSNALKYANVRIKATHTTAGPRCQPHNCNPDRLSRSWRKNNSNEPRPRNWNWHQTTYLERKENRMILTRAQVNQYSRFLIKNMDYKMVKILKGTFLKQKGYSHWKYGNKYQKNQLKSLIILKTRVIFKTPLRNFSQFEQLLEKSKTRQDAQWPSAPHTPVHCTLCT